MIKTSLLVATLIACIVAINPTVQSITIPSQYDFGAANDTSLLITSNFGVLFGSNAQLTFALPFSVNEDFEFNNSTQGMPYPIPGGRPIYVDESSFLAYYASESGFSAALVSVSSDLVLTVQNNASFSMPYPIISDSAFVNVGGNLYVATYSGPSSLTIVQFNVASFSTSTVIDNLIALLPNNASQSEWTLLDFHSLPRGEGVAVILTSEGNQLFVSAYFNQSVVINSVPAGQNLYYVGRHRGSSFGYTVGASDTTPYPVVTTWDFSDNTAVNSVNNIKGTISPKVNSPAQHFATSDAIFLYTFGGELGSVYELPYSENGILPNSVTYVSNPSSLSGNLGTGEDSSSYVYAISSISSPTDSISRWSTSSSL